MDESPWHATATSLHQMVSVATCFCAFKFDVMSLDLGLTCNCKMEYLYVHTILCAYYFLVVCNCTFAVGHSAVYLYV